MASSLIQLCLIVHCSAIARTHYSKRSSCSSEVESGKEIEFNSIKQNHAWELVPQPQHKQVIGLQWIFKTKYHADATLDKR